MYIKKIAIYSKQPRKILYRKKKARHEPSDLSMSIKSSFDKKENKSITKEEKILLKNYLKN